MVICVTVGVGVSGAAVSVGALVLVGSEVWVAVVVAIGGAVFVGADVTSGVLVAAPAVVGIGVLVAVRSWTVSVGVDVPVRVAGGGAV